MAIRIQTLREAAQRPAQTRVYKSLREAQGAHAQTAFLSHSHEDRLVAQGLQAILREAGWNLYVDWQDTTMPDTPTGETAQIIQARIREHDWFIFLATEHSTRSRWCPWEIGFADSVKTRDRLFVVPTVDNTNRYFGNEYLQLYRQITVAVSGKLAAFPAAKTAGGILVESLVP